MPKWKHWTRAGYDRAGEMGIKVMVGDQQMIDYVDPDNPMGDYREVPFPEHFEESVAHALAELYATVPGRAMLEVLERTCEKVFLTPCSPSLGNFIGISDQSAAMNQVARELLTGKRAPGEMTRRAVLSAARARNRDEDAAWLAHRINHSPRRYWPDRGAPNEFLGHSDARVTAYTIAVWLNTGSTHANPFDASWSDDLKQHVVLSTIVALEAHSAMGSGSPATIGWNVNPKYAVNRQRPPAIGLGHELVHAYFSVQGQQPGYDTGDYSTVLFEYKCVGIGPWMGQSPSENSLRAAWVPGHVPRSDPLRAKNAVGCCLRLAYGV
jgi:hypothetical protein